MILNACGHTLCVSCIGIWEQHNGQKVCAICKSPYQNTAVNYSIKSLIEQYNSRKRARQQAEDYENKLKEKRYNLERLTRSKNDLSLQRLKIEKELNDKRKDIESLLNRLKVTKAEYEKLEKRLKDAAAKEESRQQEVQSLAEEIASLENEENELFGRLKD